MAVDLKPLSFKYPHQTAPFKIGPVNARVRPAKLGKERKRKGKKRREKFFLRERGKEREERRGESTPHDGKISVMKGKERERERRERGERKPVLLLALLAMEATSVAMRREERREGRCRGREEFSSRRKPFPWRGDLRRE